MSSKENRINDTTQLQQKIIFFKAELAKYKAKIEDYENNYHYSQLRLLKQENQQLKEAKERHVAFSMKDHEIEKLTNAIIDYQEITSTFENKQKKDRLKIKNMNKAILSLYTRLTLKQTEIETAETENMNLQSENQKQKEGISHYQSINNNLSIQIEQLHKEIQTYKNDKMEFEKRSNDLKDKNKKLTTHMTELQREQEVNQQLHKEQNEQMTKLQADLKHLMDQKEDLMKEQLSLLEEIESLKSERENLEKTEKLHLQKLHDLQNQVVYHQKKREEAQALHQRFEQLNKNLQKENSALLSNQHTLHKKLETNEKQINELHEKIQELQKLNQQNLTFANTNNWFKEEIGHLKGSQDGIITKIDKLQVDIVSFISVASLLTNENQQFSTLALLEQQLKEMLEHSFEYEKELAVKTIQMKELEEKLLELTNEMKNLENNQEIKEHRFLKEDNEQTSL